MSYDPDQLVSGRYSVIFENDVEGGERDRNMYFLGKIFGAKEVKVMSS